MKNCKIVQDLLPNYIEGLTDKETNEYVKQHLNECKKCRNVYESLKENLENSEIPIDGKKVNYFKKYKRRMTQLKVIIFIVFFIIFLVFWRRMIILLMVSQKAEKNQQSDNYYVKYTQYDHTGVCIRETYRKGKKLLTILSSYNYNTKNPEYTTLKTMRFYDGESKQANIYTEQNGKKTVILNWKMREEYFFPWEIEQDWIYDDLYGAYSQTRIWNAGNFWLNVLLCSIQETKCNGRDCYYLSNFKEFTNQMYEPGFGVYIDKENGLPVRVPGRCVAWSLQWCG